MRVTTAHRWPLLTWPALRPSCSHGNPICCHPRCSASSRRPPSRVTPRSAQDPAVPVSSKSLSAWIRHRLLPHHRPRLLTSHEPTLLGSCSFSWLPPWDGGDRPRTPIMRRLGMLKDRVQDARFLAFMAVFTGFVFLLYREELVGPSLVPLTLWTARTTVLLLHWLGIEAVQAATVISHPEGFAY